MLIDVHAHIFPKVHGLTRNGPTRSLGYGLVAEGDKKVRVLPPYCPDTTFTPEMLLANLDWAGVDKAVLLQGSFYGEWNAYAANAIRKYPDRLAGLAYLDPWGGDDINDFDMLMEQNPFAGVKLECSETSGFCGIYPNAKLDDPDLVWLWEKLERYRLLLVVDLGSIGARSYQTTAIRRLAENYPNLRIVIPHLAQPRPAVDTDPQAWILWEQQISLGLLPNVWFDCAALPAYFPQEDFPLPTAGRYLRMAIERIGPTKVMWGTDQPGLLTQASLPELIKMGRLHLDFLPPEDQEMIFAKNAQKIFFEGVG